MTLPAAMAARDPEAIERALVRSLPPSVASRLTERRVDCSTAEYGYETKFGGYSCDVGMADSDLAIALETVERALFPCPKEVIHRELLRLKLMAGARTLSEDEVLFQLAIYAEELAKYPEDAVVDALRHWGRTQKWWPAWAELKELLDDRVKRRNALMEALMRARIARPVAIPGAKEEPTEARDAEMWFWAVMVPYIRNRLPDRWAEETIRGWQADDQDAIELVRALDIERKRRSG